MASLIEVRNKIASVKNTQKITQAMQLVAASRMKGFQRKAVSIRTYTEHLLALLHKHMSTIEQLPYAERRTEGKELFLLITSDKGLCGAMNNRLVKTLFRSELWNETGASNRLLVTVGRKAYDAANANGVRVEKNFQALPEDLDAVSALEIVDAVMGYWTRREVKRVHLIAPHYVNPFTFETPIRTYLPFNADLLNSHGLEIPEEPEPTPVEEPGEERLAEQLGSALAHMLFTRAFFELKATEYSSRMVAMKNATEAAGELAKSLTLDYNKARQAKITQELAEISGAVAAMES